MNNRLNMFKFNKLKILFFNENSNMSGKKTEVTYKLIPMTNTRNIGKISEKTQKCLKS